MLPANQLATAAEDPVWLGGTRVPRIPFVGDQFVLEDERRARGLFPFLVVILC